MAGHRMKQAAIVKPINSFWLHFPCIIFLFSFPTYAIEPLDGFRDLKFGMTEQEVKALKTCSTSHECLYELSDKMRYIHLTYDKDTTTPGSHSSEPPRLEKISIDMGRYSDPWYQQLQMILGNSYRLTHDYTNETMNAFLAKKFDELKAGYEDGQVVLTVVRRPFGNMTLKVVYQNTTLAAEFKRETHTPLSTTP
jgi:hypothetical protein